MAFPQGDAFGSKADSAFVKDEDVGGQEVLPALRGTPAEVVLFTVAAAEALGVEKADLIEAGSPDIHAETNLGGDSMVRPGRVSAIRRSSPARPRVPRNAAVPALEGIGADGGVVGEGGQRAGGGVVLRGGDEPVEPVVGDFGVAVEQDEVTPGM